MRCALEGTRGGQSRVCVNARSIGLLLLLLLLGGSVETGIERARGKEEDGVHAK